MAAQIVCDAGAPLNGCNAISRGKKVPTQGLQQNMLFIIGSQYFGSSNVAFFRGMSLTVGISTLIC